MKLRKIEFLDINNTNNGYEYIYGAFGKTFFGRSKYYKITFISNLPHWWWSEIQKNMRKNNLFFEDLLESESTNIGMGTLYCSIFSDQDIKKYGQDIMHWKKLLKQSVDKQLSIQKEYKKEHGDADLSEHSLFNN